MRLLFTVLFAGCLAVCAAQTSSIAAPSPQTPDSTQQQYNGLAFIQAMVQSSLELNETSLHPILAELHSIISQNHPDLNFSLTVKNITKV
ncbi:uncharacterized protein V6R79_007889 [Siganus canaliculatus]